MLKRTFDVCCSGLGLVFLSPLFLALAIWIKLDSPGPVFYRGVRVGLSGKPFRIFKFRSMVKNAENIGAASTRKNDVRVTKVGKYIRKHKLDEFSQLINVFVGDMSIVGPRPEVQKFVDLYTEEEKAILGLRPGITDWASIWNANEGAVLAKYEDADSAYETIIRPTKIKLQLVYLRERNLLVDVKIIFYTLYRIVNPSFYPTELSQYASLL